MKLKCCNSSDEKPLQITIISEYKTELSKKGDVTRASERKSLAHYIFFVMK